MAPRPATAPVDLTIGRRPISLSHPRAFPGLDRNPTRHRLRHGTSGSSDGPNGDSLALDAFLPKNDERDSVDLVDKVKQRAGAFHAHAHDMTQLERWLRDILNAEGVLSFRDESSRCSQIKWLRCCRWRMFMHVFHRCKN